MVVTEIVERDLYLFVIVWVIRVWKASGLISFIKLSPPKLIVQRCVTYLVREQSKKSRRKVLRKRPQNGRLYTQSIRNRNLFAQKVNLLQPRMFQDSAVVGDWSLATVGSPVTTN